MTDTIRRGEPIMAAKEAPEKKRMALRLPTLSLENDISYRGPLSCRLFRFLGWICIVLSFAAVMMELAVSVNAENETRRRLYYYSADVTRFYYYKSYGLSVRCLRD